MCVNGFLVELRCGFKAISALISGRALRSCSRRPTSPWNKILGGFVLLASFTAYAGEPAIELAGSTVPNKEQAQAPVYTTGESWTYRAVDKFPDGYTTDLLNGDYEITFQGESPNIKLDGNSKLGTNSLGALRQMVPVAGTLQEAQQFFNFPLWVGKKWRNTYFPEGGRRQNWRWADNEVTGIEKVTTPAGTFIAYKIERHIYFLRGPQDGKTWLTYVYFYSPETRSIVKYHYHSEIVNEGGAKRTVDRATDIELIEFASGTTSPMGSKSPLVPVKDF